jgi:hypothetical protein
LREICFQKEMRDREAAAEPRAQDTEIDYTIEAIEAEEATEFIKRYEWLGTPGHPIARYGARNWLGELAAVALFGKPSLQSSLLCRKLEYTLTRCTPRLDTPLIGPNRAIALSDEDAAYIDKVACLERGACAHWAHPHTGSWFIPRVLEQAHKDKGWEIFHAYSDVSAGEIGTIYQACNWLYIGQGSGRKKKGGAERERWTFMHPEYTKGVFVTSRRVYGDRGWFKKLGPDYWGRDQNEKPLSPLNQARAGHDGWEVKEPPAKHRYVQFVGNEGTRRKWRKALRTKPLPYPKRPLTGL